MDRCNNNTHFKLLEIFHLINRAFKKLIEKTRDIQIYKESLTKLTSLLETFNFRSLVDDIRLMNELINKLLEFIENL